MNQMNRRELGVALSAFAMIGSLSAEAQSGGSSETTPRLLHSELLLIREGELQVDSDGQRGLVHPGDVVFTASAVLHSLKNVGQGPASYFVVAVGVQKALS